MYVLGYQAPSFKGAKAVKVETGEQAAIYIANLPDDFVGIIVDLGVDSPAMKRMTGPMLVLYHNLLAETPVKKFHDLAAGRQSLLRAIERTAQDAPPEMLLASAAEEAVEDIQADNLPPDAPETAPVETNPVEEPEDGYSTDQQEADMAAKNKTKSKTKAPKAAKAKKAPKEKKAKAPAGEPRAGSKKAELLRLLSRKTGATMAEMLEATGWKACLGTAKAVTLAAKLKFRSERGTDGKASRWYAE